MKPRSLYLTMRDGVRLAVDVYLPRGTGPARGRRVPTILRQTRYHRSMGLRWPWRLALGGEPFDHSTIYAGRRRRFLAAGYAWVDVDVRGSGASFGSRLCSWSPDEIRDGAEVVDWIVAQPWSNGRVGATGNSYDGTAAEFLLVNKHPAVRAVAPRFACFDTFADIAFPGGIHNDWFTAAWREMNGALDRNAPWDIVGPAARLFVTGVTPVDEDPRGALRDAAVRGHADNYDVHAGALETCFRDDVVSTDPFSAGGLDPQVLAGRVTELRGSIGLFSPHNYLPELQDSGAAVYSYSGWMDGGYAHGAIKRFRSLRNAGSRLLLGPWNHAGGWHYNPFGVPRAARFDHDGELLRFFDLHLRRERRGVDLRPPVRYYTLVQERWKDADTWPPPGLRSRELYFEADGRLSTAPSPRDEAWDEYRPDRAACTGEGSRWKCLMGSFAPVWYGDRRHADARLLTYTSEPLPAALEVTGHPQLTVHLACGAQDTRLMAYLEDVDPAGRVSYVTEGVLRLLHRRVSNEPPYVCVVPYHSFKRADALPLVPGEVATVLLDLLPTSYLFRAGHALRIALASADRSHFSNPPGPLPSLRIHRSRHHASRLTLPTAGA